MLSSSAESPPCIPRTAFVNKQLESLSLMNTIDRELAFNNYNNASTLASTEFMIHLNEAIKCLAKKCESTLKVMRHPRTLQETRLAMAKLLEEDCISALELLQFQCIPLNFHDLFKSFKKQADGVLSVGDIFSSSNSTSTGSSSIESSPINDHSRKFSSASTLTIAEDQKVHAISLVVAKKESSTPYCSFHHGDNNYRGGHMTHNCTTFTAKFQLRRCNDCGSNESHSGNYCAFKGKGELFVSPVISPENYHYCTLDCKPSMNRCLTFLAQHGLLLCDVCGGNQTHATADCKLERRAPPFVYVNLEEVHPFPVGVPYAFAFESKKLQKKLTKKLQQLEIEQKSLASQAALLPLSASSSGESALTGETLF